MKTANKYKKDKYITSLKKPVFSSNGKKDTLTGVYTDVNIPGVRYGIVNGIVTEFGVDEAPVEDNGLRGCPAFTQLIKKSKDLDDTTYWSSGSGVTGLTIDGNKLTYIGGSPNVNLVDQSVVVPGGTSSKVLAAVCRVSADTYPQVFRIKNTHGGVVDNRSDDITITGPSTVCYTVINSAAAGDGSQRIGISPSTSDDPFNIYVGINLAEASYCFPYTPNDTESFVSVVSETGNTSFDLDDAALSKLKDVIRGPDADGRIEFTFISNSDGSSDFNILSCNNSGLSILNYSSVSGFTATDGINTASVAYVPSVGGSVYISLDFDVTGMVLSIDGVKSAKETFSGSWGSEDLKFFYANSINAGWVKDLKIYPKPRW